MEKEDEKMFNHFFTAPFFVSGKGQNKSTDTNPCQTVLRASQNQAPTLSIQESPAAACRPGMWAHAARDGVRVFV